MTLAHAAVLIAAGLAGGFVAGIIGVGGGIIFAPVLFFYYSATGTAPDIVTPMTLGSSLLCTGIAAGSSAYSQHRKGAVAWKIAGITGGFSAAAVFVIVRYVTTQAWYDGRVFQMVFGILLLLVVVRMLRADETPSGESVTTMRRTPRRRWPFLAAIGTTAGIVSPAAGIGGGIVMVPTYRHLLDLDLKQAFATSSATIVFISFAGIVNYAFSGWSADVPATAIGYVDFGRALLLAVPAVVAAHWGVHAGHQLDTRLLRWGFSALAVVVAIRLLL